LFKRTDEARRLLGWRAETTLADMLPGIVDDYVARYAPALEHARWSDRSAAERAARPRQSSTP